MNQVGRLGPWAGSHLVLFCIHRVNQVNSRNDYVMMTARSVTLFQGAEGVKPPPRRGRGLGRGCARKVGVRYPHSKKCGGVPPKSYAYDDSTTKIVLGIIITRRAWQSPA